MTLEATQDRFIRMVRAIIMDNTWKEVFFHFATICRRSDETALVIIADIREIAKKGNFKFMMRVMEEGEIYFPDRVKGGFASWPNVKIVLNAIADKMEFVLVNKSKFENMDEAWRLAEEIEVSLVKQHGRFV